MNYAIYDLASGEVVTVQAEAILAEGQGSLDLDVIPVDYVFLHYVVAGEFTLRPVSAVILSGDVIGFNNTHPDAIATLENGDGEAIEISPGDVRLASPGRYSIKVIQPFPYSAINEVFNHA